MKEDNRLKNNTDAAEELIQKCAPWLRELMDLEKANGITEGVGIKIKINLKNAANHLHAAQRELGEEHTLQNAFELTLDERRFEAA
ncbi:MAG: hypothetical protein ACYC56_07765 [Candidatus Aquicultor sp.]